MKALAIVTTDRGVEKTTLDADDQITWLARAAAGPLVPGVRPVRVLERTTGGYLMERIPGPVLADESDVSGINRRTSLVLAQVEAWSSMPADNDAAWETYLERLERHGAGHGGAVRRALDAVRDIEPFPRSWCHGDLTLENVLCGEDDTVLIDPNYSRTLYQSHVLDYGKILQSTRTPFHRAISVRAGALTEAGRTAETFLRERGLYHLALQACLTHAVRLVRHWPGYQHEIEDLIEGVLENCRSEGAL